MSKIVEPTADTQVVITRTDLLQFLYPIRVGMAEITRQLTDINRKMDYLALRRRTPVVALRPIKARR
jgi:hypothetical protein